MTLRGNPGNFESEFSVIVIMGLLRSHIDYKYGQSRAYKCSGNPQSMS